MDKKLLKNYRVDYLKVDLVRMLDICHEDCNRCYNRLRVSECDFCKGVDIAYRENPFIPEIVTDSLDFDRLEPVTFEPVIK